MTSPLHQPRRRGRCAPVGAALGAWFALRASDAWACPSCAAGDTSAAIGDGWMVALLGLPVALLLLGLFFLWKLATHEDRTP